MTDNESKDNVSEKAILQGYRKLFRFIKGCDKNLEYSCEELLKYEEEIEAGKWADEKD